MTEAFDEGTLDSIIEEARRITSQRELGTLSTGVGACVAVLTGFSDRCTPLTREQCAYVDRELKSRSAGSANWFEGDCKF